MPGPPSAKYGLVKPADADYINTWPASARSMIDAVDALMATADTTDPRPAAGKFGRLHRSPTGTISFDIGTAWVELSRSPHASRHGEGGDDPIVGLTPVAAIVPYAGTALPGGGAWAWADGGLINADIYTVFASRVGHAYNGGASPGSGTPTQGDPTVGNLVRLPDKRGRSSIGANTFGQGSAGTANSRAQWARGANGGEVAHLLAWQESGTNGNATTGGDTPDHAHAPDVGGAAFATNYGYDFIAGPGGWGFRTYTGGASARHAHYLNARNADWAHNIVHPFEVDNYIVRIA